MVIRYFEKFGQLLRQARIDAGLSQTMAARAILYEQQVLSNWERGLSAPPVAVLRKIARLYAVPIEDLYDLLMEDAVLRTRRRLEAQFRKAAK